MLYEPGERVSGAVKVTIAEVIVVPWAIVTASNLCPESHMWLPAAPERPTAIWFAPGVEKFVSSARSSAELLLASIRLLNVAILLFYPLNDG